MTNARTSPPRFAVVAAIVGAAAAVLLGVTTGCTGQPANVPANAPVPGASNGHPTTPGQLTPLSEAEFAALHVRTDQEPPAPTGEMVKLSDGSTAYLSLPKAGQAPFPAVIVIHEWWGLDGHIKHWADRLTTLGYAAVAVDLYKGHVASEPADASRLMGGIVEAEAFATLDAAYDFAKNDARIKAPKVGSVGWCLGGRWSLALATHKPIDAAVMYYGFPSAVPAERFAAIKGPLLGIFGERDAAIPMDTVREFEAALKTASVRHQILVYDAEHAFANPSQARYDKEAAAKAWAEVQKFFHANLRGSSD